MVENLRESEHRLKRRRKHEESGSFLYRGFGVVRFSVDGAARTQRAVAQTDYVVETNTALQCQSLQPITQPSAMGSTATISSTYWVFSVNFQSLGNYPDETSPATYYIGPIGCLKILGRDPANINSPYQVIYSRNVDCRFVTQQIKGLGLEGIDYWGKGVVTYGAHAGGRAMGRHRHRGVATRHV